MRQYFQDTEHPWIKSLNFKDISRDDLLRLGLYSRPLGAKPPVWVLDLDSTLFCLASRIRNIFFEFLRQHPAPQLHWHQALMELQALHQRYDIGRTFEDIFARRGIEESSKRARELWAEFEHFWRLHFFSSRYMHHDEAYPGAVEFVKTILSAGHEVAYLTARDVPRMGGGTLAVLHQAGFPVGESTHLFMKPFREESDVDFKRRASSVLRSRFDVRVFIDNEPENLVMAAREFPEAQVVLFHTVMSARIPEEDYPALLGDRHLLRLLSY